MKEPNDIKLLEYIAGQLDAKECTEVQEWIAASVEHREYFERFRQDYLKMRWAARGGLVQGNFSRLKKRIDKRRMWFGLMRYAAIIIILVSTGTWLYMTFEREVSSRDDILSITPGTSRAFLQLSSGEMIPVSKDVKTLQEVNGTSILVNENGEVYYKGVQVDTSLKTQVFNRLVIPRGGEFVVTLEDGTRVWLNSGTELRYPVNFTGDQRTVYLKGEAYFDVKKDESHPFVVMVNDLSVKVYGTQFNVNTYREGIVQTVLVSGKVAFGEKGNEVDMLPGQKAEYRKETGKIDIMNVDTEAYVAWRNGTFVFENESLENIMQTLSMWYDVDVFYTNSETRNVRLSGDMKRYKDIQELLYFFERISNVKFTIKGKIITVSYK